MLFVSFLVSFLAQRVDHVVWGISYLFGIKVVRHNVRDNVYLVTYTSYLFRMWTKKSHRSHGVNFCYAFMKFIEFIYASLIRQKQLRQQGNNKINRNRITRI